MYRVTRNEEERLTFDMKTSLALREYSTKHTEKSCLMDCLSRFSQWTLFTLLHEIEAGTPSDHITLNLS